MYAHVARRKINEARRQESREYGEREFLPKLRGAPGFVTMYLIDEGDADLVVVIWESKAQAQAFGKEKEREAWKQTLVEHGHQTLHSGGGEVIGHVTPQQ